MPGRRRANPSLPLWQVSALRHRGFDADILAFLDGLGYPLPHSTSIRGASPSIIPARSLAIVMRWSSPVAIAQVREVVEALTHCLRLSNEVLVTAVVVFEKFIRVDPSIVRVYTMRPMLIGACLIALKHNDDFVDTRRCWRRLRRVFDDLEFDHLLGIEKKLLKLIDYRLPMGIIYQTYAEALCLVANDAKGVNRAAPIVLADEYWD